jgi:hypothetical protein
LRFLNLKISSPDNTDLKIEFREGLNILSIPDKELFNLFTGIPVSGMYGTETDGTSLYSKNISCTINAESDLRGGEICFIKNNDGLTIKGSDISNEQDDMREQSECRSMDTPGDFITSSYFYPVQIQKNADPVFEKGKIKSLLISNEVYSADFQFFKSREILIQKKEKDLTGLNRDRQLLELKKMKKEKLLREIHSSERGILKLEKRRESILKYKTTLNDITSKIESRNKLSSKINNLKKDLIELREIKDKINSVESTLKEKFSHFSEKGNEQIPDLEQIQESFNTFRDINEKIDKFSLRKRRYSGSALRIISSMIIFSATALVFMLFTSSASLILGITSASAAGAAGLIGLIYFFKIRKLQPVELFEQKKNMESALIDLLKKNNFSVDNFKTGELYELLFQYFEDFINYRDISYELTDLKKKISNSSSLMEKEKKLEQLTDETENINHAISEIIENLDLSIHPRPEEGEITRTIHDIDELLDENGTEINEKKSLIIKFEEEIEEYDKIENSSLSAELRLEEILKQINECREEIEHIKFLNDVFNSASETWSSSKLEELSHLAVEKFLKITDNSFMKDDLAESFNNLILQSGSIKDEHKGLKKYISFSIKAAISELLSKGDLPPFFMIDPFTPDNEFADNMKKLLPELFPHRQVVIIIPGTDPELKGNLITLLK